MERQRQTEIVGRGKDRGREKGGAVSENERSEGSCTFGYRRKQHHTAGRSGATIKSGKQLDFRGLVSNKESLWVYEGREESGWTGNSKVVLDVCL